MTTPRISKTLTSMALTALATAAFASDPAPHFAAHEWGTFTSLVGSNGITQNGMYHEDEPLPPFVHGFGETSINSVAHPPQPIDPPPPRRCHGKGCFDSSVIAANKITQKMETPVIYFYADQALHAQVNVKFAEGVVTETYPAPIATYPSKRDGLVIANGNTTFDVDILAANAQQRVPEVSSGNIYSHARATASNYVLGQNGEAEKFIFYRGLGRFQPEIQITSSGSSLSIGGPASSLPQAAFLIDVDNSGRAQLLDLNDFFGGLKPNTSNVVSAEQISLLRSHTSEGSPTTSKLIQALVTAGLKNDEAQAMIATWQNGYLKVPGLRLLYILPRAEVDKVLPLSISPTPNELTRVFVGRIEILLQSDEQRILADIEASASYDVSKLGRFAEPILRRILEVASDGSGLQSKIKNLIARATVGAEGADNSSTSVH